MKLRLDVSLQPYNEDWAVYCQETLAAAHKLRNVGCTAQSSPDHEAIILHVPDRDPAWFKVDTEGFSRYTQVMTAWSIRLGEAPGTLDIDVKSSKGRHFLYLILDAPDKGIGVFRACAQIVTHANLLDENAQEYLKTLADYLEGATS